ncbi:MAG: biopolymer transporter ExbD [Porphyrobacter sp.]|nr:biopolymer transporter ExbD [Porphyrobacter sp.]
MPHTVTRPNLYAPRPRPIADMNVTPFIDVLLVLLIMVILATPMKADITPVDVSSGTPIEPPLPIIERNTIGIDAADRLSWNGTPVTEKELRAQVAAASAQDITPELRFEPEALASYDLSARTIALINEEGAGHFRFVGNEKYRDFN